MPAGIRIKNSDALTLQISDLVPNFVLLYSGVVSLRDGTIDAGSSVFLGSWATITLPNVLGYPPVVAIASETPVAFLRVRLEGGNWVYLYATANVGTAGNISYWAFGPFVGDPNALPKYGLKVNSPVDGRLLYHSSLRPMVIKNYISQAAGSPVDVALPAGRRIALAITSTLWGVTAQIPAGSWMQYLYATGVRSTGFNTASIIPQQQHGEYRVGNNFNFGAGTSGSWSALVLDVTGY